MREKRILRSTIYKGAKISTKVQKIQKHEKIFKIFEKNLRTTDIENDEQTECYSKSFSLVLS